jgi:hypothetical protein
MPCSDEGSIPSDSTTYAALFSGQHFFIPVFEVF